MQQTFREDGTHQFTLERDEQVIVAIGGAKVWLTGGEVGAPGLEPLVQVIVTHPTARAEVGCFYPRLGTPYVHVSILPGESHEP